MIRLFLFLTLSVIMACGTSMAENVSTCSVDTVPIQTMDRWGYKDITSLSAAQIQMGDTPPGFKAFVKKVTEHLAAKLGHEGLCLNSTESRAESLLQFVPLSLAIPKDYPPMPSMPPRKAQSFGVCRISSPWIDIAIEREPVPSVRAIIRFNERQFLADQAILDGARNVPPGMAIPLTRDEEYNQYIRVYMHRYAWRYQRATPLPPEQPIEELVPPDVLWLLDHIIVDNLPGLVNTGMPGVILEGEEGYTKIVMALIDRCFDSDEVDIKFNSVLDVADLVPLEQYKSKRPIQNRLKTGASVD